MLSNSLNRRPTVGFVNRKMMLPPLQGVSARRAVSGTLVVTLYDAGLRIYNEQSARSWYRREVKEEWDARRYLPGLTRQVTCPGVLARFRLK